MDVSDFEHAIKLGLGRAILHLQTHDAAPYRDIILQACLKNSIYLIYYDKSAYVLELIELSGEKEYYRQYILDAARQIDKNTNSQDREFLLDLVQSFAENGDKKARRIIIRTFIENPAEQKDWWAVERVIAADGLRGFLKIAEMMGKYVPADDEIHSYTSLLHNIEKHLGKAVATQKLSEARKENEHVDAYLKAVEAIEAERKLRFVTRKTIQLPENLPYVEIKNLIHTGKGMNFGLWGEKADSKSLLQAANDLMDALKNDDTPRLRHYLRIFGKTPFPLDHQPLLKLVDYPDDSKYFQIPISTLILLQNIAHHSVRELAFNLINENRYTDYAIGLLQQNFEDGDWEKLEEITKREFDMETHHFVGFNIIRVFEKNPSKQAIPSLLHVYEQGHCSYCRWNVIKALHSIAALPEYIREECVYDSNPGIRALAKRNFEPETQ